MRSRWRPDRPAARATPRNGRAPLANGLRWPRPGSPRHLGDEGASGRQLLVAAAELTVSPPAEQLREDLTHARGLLDPQLAEQRAAVPLEAKVAEAVEVELGSPARRPTHGGDRHRHLIRLSVEQRGNLGRLE